MPYKEDQEDTTIAKFSYDPTISKSTNVGNAPEKSGQNNDIVVYTLWDYAGKSISCNDANANRLSAHKQCYILFNVAFRKQTHATKKVP